MVTHVFDHQSKGT